MAQQGRRGRLNPHVGSARGEFARVLNDFLGAGNLSASGNPAKNKSRADQGSGHLPLFLVGVSGGADSLALAAVGAHFVRRKDIQLGAVIVDHGLQEGSDRVALAAAQQCRDLGLAPVEIKKVRVDSTAGGPEKAAQLARYGAFEEAVAHTGARAVLLAHTLDDQAETVLLGLARGSGTKSLAGMPEIRVTEKATYLRPLLKIRRNDIEEICGAEGLEPWQDPTNTDQRLMRARVRHSILPFLEGALGGDVAVSLARTAAILGPDAQLLDQQAQAAFANPDLRIDPAELALPPRLKATPLALDRARLCQLPTSLRRRVLTLAVTEAGGHAPGFERIIALDDFCQDHAIAGPLQLSGHVSAWRARPAGKYQKTGVILLGRSRSQAA